MDREGGYVTRPPLLDDSNYDIWKARMIAFLKSMDNRTWKNVLKGWEHPKVKDANGADTDELKPEEDWTAAEDSLALGNSKALNALFNGVDKNMFRLIKKCKVAKDAWEILKTTQEGTAKVKISRLQNLTRKFENLRMKEDESVHNFYINVMDFANSFDDLGEKLSDEKIVRKILRSLTKKFDMKVIAMEEAQDISTMKVDELIGSLQTYESSVNERIKKKNKSIAFVSNTEDEDLESDMESTDSVSEAIVLLGRQFNKVLKRMDRRPRQNAKHLATDMSRNIGNSRKTKIDEKPAKSKGIQCHECEGYGHIRTECATYLKKQKKKLNVTWSDEVESEEEGESEVAKHVTVLTGIVTSDKESCDEEVSYDELAETYRDICLGELLMKGVRSKDNCYLWAPQEDTSLSTCLIAKEDECQHLTTTRVLELLHMDLMGPMQVLSLGGKREKNEVILRIRSDHGKEFQKESSMNSHLLLHLNKMEWFKGRIEHREQRRKLDPKSDEGIFLGYSSNSRAYRVYNSRTKVIMESSNVVVDDSAEERSTNVADDAITSNIQSDEPDIVEEVENSIESSKPDPTSTDPTNDPPKKGPSNRVQKNHPQELIIEDDLWVSSLMCLTNSKEDDNVKKVENPNAETVKDFETLGLANLSCIEKLGKTGPSCSDPPTVSVGALLEAKSDSVLEHDKKNAPEEDVAHNARQPTNILTRDQIIDDLKEVSRILGEKKGGDTGVEEEHSDASPLVCSA
ncbi:hypothetical protein TSUD_168190 [Trifolium subterraneum]|nr:hypothetical protein TSUD_168190 [Trifolium subterraneum]